MSAADKVPKTMFKHGAAEEWTPERIGRLSQLEIKQLRANAERLNEPALVDLCSEVLKAVRKQQRAK
ncbi:MAG TPA: hypothetical protein VL286_08340 [Rhizomicrobium sp.]|jgi:hypothetical protein|nr:hypothetical protein [Rhizomicrobium sp.]